MPSNGKPVGRPSLFDQTKCEQAYKLCLLGATDAQMADFFGVGERALNNWKTEHPEFMHSITRGKLDADADIASSLFHRAKGYSHPEVHVSSYEGQITLTDLTKHYPPDTQAASLWLRNRQPKLWRDKTEIANQALDKNGNPTDPAVPTLLVTIAKAVE